MLKKEESILGFQYIRNRELQAILSTYNADNETKEEFLLKWQCIDDLLGIQKMSSVADTFGKTTRNGFQKKNVKYTRDLLADRIDVLINELNELK